MTTLSSLQVHAIIWFLTKSSAVIRDFSYLTRFLVERGSTVDIFVLSNFSLFWLCWGWNPGPCWQMLYVELYSQITNFFLVVGVSCSLVSAKQSDRHWGQRREPGRNGEGSCPWWVETDSDFWESFLVHLYSSGVQLWGGNHDSQSHVGFWPLLLPHFPGQNPSNPPCKPQYSKKPG